MANCSVCKNVEDFENKTILNGNYKIKLYHNWN